MNPCHLIQYHQRTDIDMGLLSPFKNIDLLQKVGRKRRKVRCRKNKRILGDSIEVRPPEISKRETFGHWEIDTVVGTQSKGKSLLTILERILILFTTILTGICIMWYLIQLVVNLII